MISIPQLKRLEKNAQLEQYGKTYLQCSGLPVPEGYLCNPNNRVYAAYFKKQMIGGFILGKGQSLRTVEVFAKPAARNQLYKTMGEVSEFTEITCFWISPKFRSNVALNTFVWMALAFCLRCFGTSKTLFGTCSSSLTKLYSVTPNSEMIHQDYVNGKRTFIFQGKQKESLKAFAEIIWFKLNRTLQIFQYRQLMRNAA